LMMDLRRADPFIAHWMRLPDILKIHIMRHNDADRDI